MALTLSSTGQGGVFTLRGGSFGGRFQASVTPPTIPIVSSGLIVYLDAGNPLSYAGTGPTWFDISGNSANATIFNSPTYSTLNGGYFVMNGTNNYITPSTSVLGTNTTQTIWYKWNGVNQAKILAALISTDGNTGYGMYMNDGSNSGTAGNRIVGIIPFNSYNGGGVTSPLSSTNWTQITMIRNASLGQMQFYINGIFNGGGNSFANGADTVLPFTLGSSGAAFVAGNLGAAMLYNRALSAAEVLQNYNATKTRFGL